MANRKINTIVLIVLKAPTNQFERWEIIVPHLTPCSASGWTREETLTKVKETILQHTEIEPVPADYILNDQTSVDMRMYGELEVIDIETMAWFSDESCDPEHDALLHKITAPIPRVAVGAIIINTEGEVLTCRRPLGPENYVGKIHTFGGKVDLGETLFQAISREVLEECNIDVHSQSWKVDMVGTIEEIEPDCSIVVNDKPQMYHWISAIWVFWLKDATFKNMEPHKHLDMKFRALNDIDPLDIAPSAYHSLVLSGLLKPSGEWFNNPNGEWIPQQTDVAYDID